MISNWHDSGNNKNELKRYIALVFTAIVSIAAGTPYLYGIYSPQLIQRVGFTTSDSATITLFTNAGIGFGGFFGGIIIDRFGPRLSIFLGSLGIFCGYFGVYQIYRHATANLGLICLCLTTVGAGSIISYFASLKAAQANFPAHKGSAGAIPVSCYGLAATIFSLIAATFFNETGGLLEFLAYFCGIVSFIGSFFVVIFKLLGDNDDDDDDDDDDYEHVFIDSDQVERNSIDEESCINSTNDQSILNYQAIRASENNVGSSSSPIKTSSSTRPAFPTESLRGSFSFWGIGSRTPRGSSTSLSSDIIPILKNIRDSDQTSQNRPTPNLSRNNSFSKSKSTVVDNLATPPTDTKFTKLRIPKRPQTSFEIVVNLLKNPVFLTHYVLVSLASGVGQMYIYSVGFIVAAQYNASKRSGLESLVSSASTPAQIQAVQVSAISLASFCGRLLSGFLSDFLYKTYHIQRLWIVLVTLCLEGLNQFLILSNTNNVHFITVTSAITGISYGLIFGVYPAIVADVFGTKSFSTTWGLVCTGPLITLYFLNKYFGIIYDSHTNKKTGICFDGNKCYKGAFELSFTLCFFMIIINLVLIYVQRKKRNQVS